ncbi:MAG: hypothetical protein ABI680_03260 [Chthoniobacteraceae bacterium]
MKRPRHRGDFAFALFLGFIAGIPGGFAGEARPAAPDHATLRVWLEPKFMHAPVTAPIEGAQKTELAAGTLSETDCDVLPKSAFEALGLTWDEFRRQTQVNAAADLASITPHYERNASKVIDYAVLESKRPIVASAVLAPGFLETFKDTLGETVLVVVPTRFTAFVFPKLASEFGAFAPVVFRAYRGTAWPVSVEVFEVSARGWKCVGAYTDR